MRLLNDERGTALIISLMAIMLLSALGMALVLTSNTETMITANYRNAQEALYAADAGVERSMQDLLLVPSSSWSSVLDGTVASGFVDAPPSVLPDGRTADLDALTRTLQGDTDALYGSSNQNRPVWKLYAHAPISDLLPEGAITTRSYIIVWAADDPGETDNDPAKDVNGIITLRALAFSEGGARKIVETTVAHTSNNEMERGYVGQRGQDEQNRRARKTAVQTPGGSLTEMRMSLSTGGLAIQ